MRGWFLALLLLLAGCSAPLDPQVSEGVDTSEGPEEKLRWIGHSDAELVQELGVPEVMLNTTLLGGPSSVAYVYTDPTGCLDAYVVIVETGKIIKYFCR